MRPLHLVIKDGKTIGWTYCLAHQMPQYELKRCDKEATKNLPQIKPKEDGSIG